MTFNRFAAAALSICAAGALFSAFPQQASAQGAGAAMKGKPSAKMNSILDQLNLTTDQKAKIKPIEEDSKSKVMAIITDKSLTRDQMKVKITPIMKDSREKIMEILTPAQRTKAKEIMEQKKAAAKEKAAAPTP